MDCFRKGNISCKCVPNRYMSHFEINQTMFNPCQTQEENRCALDFLDSCYFSKEIGKKCLPSCTKGTFINYVWCGDAKNRHSDGFLGILMIFALSIFKIRTLNNQQVAKFWLSSQLISNIAKSYQIVLLTDLEFFILNTL